MDEEEFTAGIDKFRVAMTTKCANAGIDFLEEYKGESLELFLRGGIASRAVSLNKPAHSFLLAIAEACDCRPEEDRFLWGVLGDAYKQVLNHHVKMDFERKVVSTFRCAQGDFVTIKPVDPDSLPRIAQRVAQSAHRIQQSAQRIQESAHGALCALAGINWELD